MASPTSIKSWNAGQKPGGALHLWAKCWHKTRPDGRQVDVTRCGHQSSQARTSTWSYSEHRAWLKSERPGADGNARWRATASSRSGTTRLQILRCALVALERSPRATKPPRHRAAQAADSVVLRKPYASTNESPLYWHACMCGILTPTFKSPLYWHVRMCGTCCTDIVT